MAVKHEKKRLLAKIVSISAMIICIIAFFLIGKSLSYQELADWIPHNHVLAALLVILLYAVKSLTAIFPLLTLYLLSGIIFPTPAAIFVNVLGLAVCDTVPYLIGKLFASERQSDLRRKYPKLEILETLRQKSGFQFAALTRAIGLLPGDVVSLYFGCTGLNYPAYLAGSILGLAPGMIAATILGSQISSPGSPEFLIAAGCGTAVAVISFAACKRVVAQETGKGDQTTDEREDTP